MLRKSRKRSLFATITLAILLTFTIASPIAKADDTAGTDLHLTITSGPLYIVEAPTSIDFGTLALADTDIVSIKKLPSKVKVADLRGTQTGWRLDVSATQFASTGGAKLPKGSLYINSTLDVARDVINSSDLGGLTGDTTSIEDRLNAIYGDASYNPDPTNVTNALPVDDGSTVNIAKAVAGKGMGTFAFTDKTNKFLALKLNSQAVNLSGANTSYSAILTWDLISAP